MRGRLAFTLQFVSRRAFAHESNLSQWIWCGGRRIEGDGWRDVTFPAGLLGQTSFLQYFEVSNHSPDGLPPPKTGRLGHDH
jgi:hypothetical protein